MTQTQENGTSKPIDFLYEKIRRQLLNSYESDFDNSVNQLEIHLDCHQERYDPRLFKLSKRGQAIDIINYLNELQAEVDEIVGMKQLGDFMGDT